VRKTRGNRKISKVLSGVTAGLLLVLSFGCQLRPTAPAENAVGIWEQGRDYGEIPPEEINENLTPQQLERMFVALEDIPLEGLWEGEDPNGAMPPIPKRIGPGSRLKARKAYLQGREFISQGAFGAAVGILTKGLELDPNSAAINELLAKAYYNQNSYSAAESAARRALQFDKDNITAYQILGSIRQEKKELARALSFYYQALRCKGATAENPMTAVLHLQLARALMEMGYLAASAQEYDKAYILLHQQRRYSQAALSMEKLTRQMHLPLLTRVSLYVRMGQIEQAVQALLETEKLFSARVDLLRAFVISLASRRMPIQIRFRQVTVFCRYLIAVRYEVEHVLAIYYEACRKMAKHQDYVDTLGSWHTPTPPNRMILAKREYAYGLYLAEKDEQAEKIWLAMLSQPPSTETALVHRDLARLYRRKHKWQAMLVHYGRFLELQPGAREVLSAEMTEQTASISDLESLLEQWRNEERLCGHYGSSYLLGLLAEQQEKPELAEFYYQRSLSEQLDFEPARTRLFELLLKRQQYSKLMHWIRQYNLDEQAAPELRWYAGRAYAGMGRLAAAVVCFEQVIAQDAEHIQGYLDLAEVLMRQEDFVQAEEVLRGVRRTWPGRQEVNKYLLILYAVWSAQPSQNDQFYLAAEKRAWQMMDSLRKEEPTLAKLVLNRKSPVSPEVKHVISILSEYVRKYPDGRILGMIFARLLYDAGEYERAAQEIDRVLVQYPEHIQCLSMGALFHEKADDYARAGELRQRIWQQRPEDPHLLVKALAAFDQGRQSQKALELLLNAWGQSAWQDRRNIQILQESAFRLFQVTRHYEQAVELYQRWYEITKPTSEKVANDKGDIHRIITENLIWALIESGDYPRAFQEVRSYQKYYEPKEPYLAIYLARALNIRHQYERSVEWLGELLQLGSGNESLRLQYYLTLIQQGRVEESLAAARTWSAAQPEQKNRLKILTFLLRWVGKNEQAAQRLRQYVDSAPNDYDLRFDLIDTLREGGSYDEAEKVLASIPQKGKWASLRLSAQVKIDITRGECQRALARIDNLVQDKKSPEVEELKVEILVSCGQEKKAVERIEKLIEENPDEHVGLLWYSNFLSQREKTDKAVELLESLLQKQPDNALLKNNLAYSLIEANRDPQRSRRLLEESLHAEPDSGPTLDSMGWLYYKEGKFEQALGYIYQAAGTMATPDPEVLDHLGDTVYRLGRPRQARQYWRQAVAILEHRLPGEKNVRNDKDRIEGKIRQLNAGKEVTVTSLFDE